MYLVSWIKQQFYQNFGLKWYYTKLFPLTSIRRFIVDQIISWLSFLGFYSSIIIGSISAISLLLYFIGRFANHLLPMTSKNGDLMPPIIAGFIWSLFLGIIVGIFIIIIIALYDLDYQEWLKAQLIYKTELENGIKDIEADQYVPIKTTCVDRYINAIFPPATIWKYFGRLLLYITIFVTVIITHVFVSALTFPFNGFPLLIKWLISLVFQILLGLVIYIIYIVVESGCREEWRKFKLQRESALDKK